LAQISYIINSLKSADFINKETVHRSGINEIICVILRKDWSAVLTTLPNLIFKEKCHNRKKNEESTMSKLRRLSECELEANKHLNNE